MKKLLLASDSFKGTLSSKDIVSIAQKVISDGFKNEWELDYQILADGGEGTVEAFSSILDGKMVYVDTIDAERSPIKAPIFVTNNGSAFIEVASVVGLPMVKGSVDPLERTSKGLGILIKEALKLNIKKIYIGLGGSSTNDLGIGMLEELGVKFIGVNDVSMMNADKIEDIDASSFLLKDTKVEFICLSDVTNPLLGENGATYVFGPQKGYGTYLDILEERMGKLADLYEKVTKKSIKTVPGSGAAGGLGAAFYSFFDATMRSGIEEILNLSNFKERAAKADLVITGEGSFDEQSLHGKVFTGVSKYAPKEKIVVLCGVNKMDTRDIPIYETSPKGVPFEYIKEHAKEGYAATLRKVLESKL